MNKNGHHDLLTRFLLQEAGVRGVRVHLDATWEEIRARSAYPTAIEELLGEACVAAALFTGHAKVDGRLSVQLRGSGPLRTLFAECTAAGTLRGIAQHDEDAPVSRDLRELGDDAVLAITIENPGTGAREPVRYQGLVALESDTLAGAFEGYFRQSEQLPTRLLLGADRGRAAGLMLQKLPGDAGDEDCVREYIARAQSEFGGLDIVWANAGISGGWVDYQDQDAAHWAEILRINLIGAFLAVKHASAVMIPKGKGSIILTASVAGIRSGAGGSPYSASKAGVISLAQTAANEFYGTGVRINAIAPGLIETGMTKPIFDRAKERGTQGKIGQLNPLQRPGQPHELAAMGLFLASDEASYVNGQAFPVDGGLTASMPYTGKPV